MCSRKEKPGTQPNRTNQATEIVNKMAMADMTVEEFLAGAETPAQKQDRKEWRKYQQSRHYAEEIEALLENEVYDGPTGDA